MLRFKALRTLFHSVSVGVLASSLGTVARLVALAFARVLNFRSVATRPGILAVLVAHGFHFAWAVDLRGLMEGLTWPAVRRSRGLVRNVYRRGDLGGL
ncbi:hypothetical protein D2E28_23730 [Mycobacteroides abscessus]|nr:hypothetical protein D2E28_23730 [Mycobacteroides abscessus]